ncbi:MAG: M23 family metallopeptidase [Dysgonamonadaceae bacterium]|jgi:lipoprotein NlpD|nr:M23 family metallopeptidase [Dysgonamonadaceae bacterium]
MSRFPKKMAFWKRIRFKYKLSFLNENTLEEVFSFRLSRLSGFLALVVFAALLIALTSVVIIKTPIRNYLPGYMASEIRQEMIDNSLKTDSLEQHLHIQSKYLDNIRAILRGDMKVDEIPKIDSLRDNANVDLEKSKTTAKFIRNFEEEEKYNLNALNTNANRPDIIMFFRPVNGLISSAFSLKEKHYGIDIATTPKSSVVSTTKGTVIYTGFDANAGYVIQIQHQNGYVSVYKHNASLLKRQGDEVNGGETIALAGSTGNYSTGDHLHFELWYKGKPVDPKEYINFN